MGGLEAARVQQDLDNGNFVLLKVKHKTVRTLIDTGAHFSCVSLSLLKRLHLESDVVPAADYKKLYTADGKAMKVFGTILLSVNIQGLIVPFTFHVLEHLTHNLILGINFLSHTKANIDMASRSVTFYDDLVGLSLTNTNETLLRTVDAVLIPPKSEALIPVSVPPHFGRGLAIIEPTVNLHTKHLALAKAIVCPKQNNTVCKLLNPTNASIFLRRRSTVAVINKLSIDSINVIDDSAPRINEDSATISMTVDDQLKAIAEKGIKLEQNSLSREQFEKLTNLIFRNLDLFATGMKDLVGTDVLYHSIDTGDAEPVRKRAYRQSPEMMREMQRQVKEMLDAGIVQESESPWSSPCLLIKKSGVNEYRFVNYLRGINKLTKLIYWPMPTMNDIFDTVTDRAPTIFTNIDLKHAYFQVKLTDESKPKTAFTVAGKNYEYCRMVMGLNNSAQCWQRLLTKVLSDMLFTSAIVYLDDVLLLSKNFEQHLTHLEMVFERFRKAKLHMNGKKCKFDVNEVRYLGHILSAAGVSVDRQKTEIITSWPKPKNAKQVKSFLGVANYYRRFLERYSQRSAPLRELTAKDKLCLGGQTRKGI